MKKYQTYLQTHSKNYPKSIQQSMKMQSQIHLKNYPKT